MGLYIMPNAMDGAKCDLRASLTSPSLLRKHPDPFVAGALRWINVIGVRVEALASSDRVHGTQITTICSGTASFARVKRVFWAVRP